MPPLIRNLAKDALRASLGAGRFQWRTAEGEVALTFDDGPHPEFTAPLLDLLDAHGIRATFFLIGERVVAQVPLVREIVARGHAVASHTWSHDEIPGRSLADLDRDLSRCRALLADVAGVDTVLFRPPRGRMDLGSVRKVVSLGYRVVHWSHTYGDYQCDGADALAARMRARPARGRDILLLHDHNPFTLAALRQVLPAWRAGPLRFTALR